MTEILLELDSCSLSEELLENKDVMLVKSDRFDGDSVFQLVVTLSTVSVPLIAKVVIEKIKANKHVVIKKNGIIVKGLSAENALKVIKELDEND
ncbi:hypothetical protein AB1740_001258 [Vibrio fluvialis]|uniref:hypothetical protein n=1 Tax=Vibrio fluvialis TaxID=676 RepID=UPI0015597DA6|nr:hypothetical protein [Vibrio fluvialis]EKO3903374.1 hypothetical protein [Vibrio fluvialis]MBY8222879.1 hypothetical protein [Vibrio fluvialis]